LLSPGLSGAALFIDVAKKLPIRVEGKGSTSMRGNLFLLRRVRWNN
jgi:hypothetical protein